MTLAEYRASRDAAIIRERLSGRTIAAVASACLVSERTVGKVLKRAGVLTPKLCRGGVESFWTDSRVAVLERAWGSGASAASVAEEIGGGCTRNMVIGKAHRMSLAPRPSPIRTDDPEATAARRLASIRSRHQEAA